MKKRATKPFQAVVVIYKPWHLVDGRTLWGRVDTELAGSKPDASRRARNLNRVFADPAQIKSRSGHWMAFAYPHKWYRFFFREVINIWE